MKYRETPEKSRENKATYAKGFEHIIQKRLQQMTAERKKYAADIFKEPERYRADLKAILGWPLVEYEDTGLPPVKAQKLSDEEGYTVWRMEFEVMEGLVLTGLLFRQESEKPLPLVLVQHGKLGTPELISGIYDKTGNYNDMLSRVIRCGVHAFAPQLLLWSEGYEVPYDRDALDIRLKHLGGSVTAVEVHALGKLLDYFETQEYVKNFGMVGLSYGGFYTLFTTALDTRIRSSISCSFFNTMEKYFMADWMWFDSARRFDAAEVACLAYPRRLCLEMGDNDSIFDLADSVASFERIQEMCREVGTDWVEFIGFSGTHEFCLYDEPIQRLAEDLKK